MAAAPSQLATRPENPEGSLFFFLKYDLSYSNVIKAEAGSGYAETKYTDLRGVRDIQIQFI